MIIKVTRGNDFAGAVDYVARLGVYARKGVARIIAMNGLYDLRTAAAQLAYDAALDPGRSRPVVHLIARAEKGLDDERYIQLINKMLKAAGLEGHRFLAAVHDDDDHLHVIVSEVNEDGAVPPRILWHNEEKRVVSADEAKSLPRGTGAGRAWDSHLAWRLTRVARDVEVAWDLRRLSSSSKTNTPVEPRREQWQKERLKRTGKVPLQDRYWDEIRAALVLPTWDERAAALATHALVIRAHEVGGRVRGLQVQSLTDAQDFVKISAFEMGGMAKLDASAGQPFLEWAAQEQRQFVSLIKPVVSRNPEMIAMLAAFKVHQNDWHRREGSRFGAYRQRKRDTAVIDEAMDDFDNRFRPILSRDGFRRARAEHRRGLKDIADQRLAAALADAGPSKPKPVFIDFVKARAGAADADAVRVYRDLVGDVSETRRRAFDGVTAMAHELALAVRVLSGRRDRLQKDIAAVTIALRRSADELAQRAAIDATRLKVATRRSLSDLRMRMADLAERLARRLDDANHRIRVQNGIVRVDRWQPSSIEREIVDSLTHRPVFERHASVQTSEVNALRDDIRRTRAARRIGRLVAFDEARSGIGNPRVLRWTTEPEVVAVLHDVDREHRHQLARVERADAEHRQRDAAAALDRLRAAAVAHMAALSAWLTASMAADLRRAGANLRARQAELVARERQRGQKTVAAVVAVAPPMDRTALIAAMAPRGRFGSAEHTYRDQWRSAINKVPPQNAIDIAAIQRIEIDVARALIHQGFFDAVVRTMVRDHSPLRMTDTPGTADTRADQVLAQVLADPSTRRIRDEKAAEQAERLDRAATVKKLVERQAFAPSQTRFVELWREILDERPLDTTISPAERNRSIDHDVAAAMLHEGITLLQTRAAIMRLSPAFKSLPSRERPAYVDGQIEALDHVLRRMTPGQLKQAGPKPASAATLANMRALPKDTYDESLDDHFNWVSGELPLRPRSIAHIAVNADGRANISGLDVHFADVGGAGTGDGKPASSDVGMPLFDAAGQALPHVRAILEGIRQHRAAFSLVEGRLTAPGQAPENQKLLNELLADPRFERLALIAYRGPFGGGTHPVIGDGYQR